MGNEGKKPNIHFGGGTPVSPYVIDLRRPAAPIVPVVSQPKKSKRPIVPKVFANRPRPEEIVAIIFDPSHDLLPTASDLIGQWTETDFTENTTQHSHNEPTFQPLLSTSVTDFFSPAKADLVVEAFTSLQLPEAEFSEAVSWDENDEEIELPTQHSASRLTIFRWHLPHGWQKTIAAFVGLSFLFVLPIHAMQQVEIANTQKSALAEVGANALKHLSLGQSDLGKNDFALAQEDFAAASASFASAQSHLSELSLEVTTLLHALPGTASKLQTADALIVTGNNLSEAASLFTQALSEIEKSSNDSPITKLDVLTLYLERMQPLVSGAVAELPFIDNALLPESNQSTIELIKTTLPSLNASIEQFLAFNKEIRLMLGGNGPMRYLVLFQNNSEARATGGFIGSFAEVTIDNGKLTGVTVPGGGSYDLQGSLSDFVKAPQPLALINPRFEFQDANWFPDFPTSAKKLLQFYDHAGGPTIDGVLAINATYVADLLALLGPVEMESYGRTITSENFLSETQKIVELESDKTLNKPKQFIADLTPKLLDRLTNADAPTFLNLLQHVGGGLQQKDVQLYFTDPALQKPIETLGWAGAVTQTTGDYLMVINSNIGGGKTDLFIQEDIRTNIDIENDGSVINSVTITRTHTAPPSDTLAYVNNVDYVRLFVPLGSTLLSTTGDIAPPSAELFKPSSTPLNDDPEVTQTEQVVNTDVASGTVVGSAFQKTTFGNWIQTKPGTTSITTFRYRLPFTVAPQNGFTRVLRTMMGVPNTTEYSLFVQKQSGADNRTTHVTVFPSDALSPAWSSDETLLSTGVTFPNTNDTYFASLFTKR